MRTRLQLLCLLMFAALLASGCSDEEANGTRLVVSVDAEQALQAKLTRVVVESFDLGMLDGAGKPTLVGTVPFAIKTAGGSKGETFPFTFGVAKNKADSFLLVVSGYEGERVIIEQKSRVTFVNGQVRKLTILLAERCVGMICGDRSRADWFQSSCDSGRGTCSDVTTPITTPVEGKDDDAGAEDGSVVPTKDGGQILSDGQVAPALDGGPSPSAEGGVMDATSTSDTGSAVSDSGSASDTGAVVDAQPTACGSQTCVVNARCVATPSQHCECNAGFQGTPTVSCTNVNDCTATSCAAPATCADGLMDFTCACPTNYFQATPKTCAPHFVSIAASGGGDRSGGSTNCARRADGTVSCWGRNGYGQFGDNASGSTNSTPVTINAWNGAAELAVGSTFVCARRTDGTVWCAGRNSEGQCGHGSNEASFTTPVQVVNLMNVVEISAGYGHACARRMNGTVACWGEGGSGQLGNGAEAVSFSPVEVTGLTNAVELAAGAIHTCARRMDNKIVCWGANSSGQLGNGMTVLSSVPVEVLPGGAAGTPVLVNPVGLAVGEWHTCARLQSGSVACWGSNGSYQLGRNGSDGSTPTLVGGLSDAQEISANFFYTCARRATGTVSCWGIWPGQVLTPAPTPIMGVTGAVEIASGRWHSCARRSDGNVVCWGINDYGQLGNGMTNPDDMYITTAVQVKAF